MHNSIYGCVLKQTEIFTVFKLILAEYEEHRCWNQGHPDYKVLTRANKSEMLLRPEVTFILHAADRGMPYGER
jgi:hypothetical protein